MSTNDPVKNLSLLNAKFGLTGGYFFYRPAQSTLIKLLNLVASYPDHEELTQSCSWHCTVMYSRVDGSEIRYIGSTPPYALIKGIDHWTDHKGREIIVCSLNFPLAKLQNRALWKGGWEHSFPDYNAHITLVKNASSPEWAEDVSASARGVSLEFDPNLIYTPLGI